MKNIALLVFLFCCTATGLKAQEFTLTTARVATASEDVNTEIPSIDVKQVEIIRNNVVGQAAERNAPEITLNFPTPVGTIERIGINRKIENIADPSGKRVGGN